MNTRSSRASHAAAAVLLVVLAAGCSTSTPSSTTDASATDSTSAGTGASSGSPTASSDSPSPADSSPAQEGTGAESPQPAQQGGPTISVASLPIGGNTEEDGARQCGHVNLIPPSPLPPGIKFSINSIELTPAGIFSISDDPCGSAPPCTTSWTWTSEAPSECTVAVTQLIDSTDTVTLTIGSTATCPDQSTCDRVESEFKGNGSQVRFTALAGVAPAAPATSPSATEASGS
ncbi:MAG TPA: hypothetical protein VF612_09215 [Jatrophihabitans sp.]|jgi:hypothetical protein|uniref:hypothetical protein n=1 Tax=Jatrophihabitans sp. TaxID=1932789 RepID=UPI002F0B8AA5